jgi:hypothetical protein
MSNYWLLKELNWEVIPHKFFGAEGCCVIAPSGRRFDVIMVWGYTSFEDVHDPNVKSKPLISIHELDGKSPKAECMIALEMAGDYFCGRTK